MVHLENKIKKLKKVKKPTPIQKAQLQRYRNIERREAQQKKKGRR